MVGRTQFLLETSQGIQTPPGHLSRTRSKQNISGVIAMIKIYSKRNKSVLLWMTVFDSNNIIGQYINIYKSLFIMHNYIILYYITTLNYMICYYKTGHHQLDQLTNVV